MRYLEGVVALLILIMSGCFFANWAVVLPDTDGLELARGWVVPFMRSYALRQAVGTLGAVIMPHNLYLHSSLVLSRRVDRNRSSQVHEAIRYNAIESGLALLFSFAVNLAIVAVFATAFFDPQCAGAIGGPFACRNIDSSEHLQAVSTQSSPQYGIACGGGGRGGGGMNATRFDVGGGAGLRVMGGRGCAAIGLEGAGTSLETALGGNARLVWGIGLLAAGQASTMTCTYAGQVIMSGFMDIDVSPFMRVVITRVVALGPALAVAVGTADNPRLTNDINEWLNILQSVCGWVDA
jgi:natural resistance-associated macrophage protein